MRSRRKFIKKEALSREESIKNIVFNIYTERKMNSEREEKNRIKKIQELTKGKKIEVDNSKGDPLPDSYTMVEAR